MDLSGLLPALLADPAAAEAVDSVRARGELDVVGPAGIRPPLLAALAQQRPLVVVTATGRDADELAAAVRCYLPADDVAVLPAWETLPHERLSPRSDTVARRLAVFRRLAHPEGAGYAGPDPGARRARCVRSCSRWSRVWATSSRCRSARATASTSRSSRSSLAGAAYTRVDMVERRGEFAVRGGIVDVFPPTEDHPLRVELWGEDVEEIRWFSVADQRSLEVAEHGVWAPPCREILLTDAVRAARDRAHPAAARRHGHARPAGPGDRRRGHGVARAGAGGPHGAGAGPRARREPGRDGRPRARAAAGARPRRDDAGVPRGGVDLGGGGRGDAAGPVGRELRVVRRGARALGRPRAGLVDAEPVHAGRRRGAGRVAEDETSTTARRGHRPHGRPQPGAGRARRDGRRPRGDGAHGRRRGAGRRALPR